MTRTDAFWSAMRELSAALVECDLLGFDSVSAARSAVLEHDDYAQRWECSARVVLAVNRLHFARAIMVGKAVPT